MADGRFDCEDCGAELSFGASECAECGTRYRYAEGRPIAEGEREPESERPAVAPQPFRYPPPVDERSRGFAPSKALAASVSLALLTCASLNFFAVLLAAVPPRVLSASVRAKHDELLMLAEILLAGAVYLSFFGAAVLFLFWIHDANRSARALGAKRLRYTPRAAVLWWFVPLANFVAPYRAMAELWRVSHARTLERWTAVDTSAVMPCWWALWLGMHLMGWITDVNESSGSPSRSAPVVAALVNAAAALLAAFVVFSIQRGLSAKADAGAA